MRDRGVVSWAEFVRVVWFDGAASGRWVGEGHEVGRFVIVSV
ncbi:MAG TPA: hypothetical protein VFV66_28030 [Nonomuraea sp.]|nr:hypothetical protein [Nonomuraea sp.]